MIPLKTVEEMECIKKSALLVSRTLSVLAEHIQPGVSTLTLNRIADECILSYEGAIPSFKGYKGFPFSVCASVNDTVVHGFPNNTPLEEGDLVSVDVGIVKNGFHGDSAYTFLLKSEDSQKMQRTIHLMQTTKQALHNSIAFAVSSFRLGDIGFAIQQHCEKQGYGVVRELTGHGIGKQLHEPPNVPNYGKRCSGKRLQKGMVIAIEPMINMGTHKVYTEKDGWAIRTKDHKVSAHYEHTVAIGEKKAVLLSTFAPIEEAIAKNNTLCNI